MATGDSNDPSAATFSHTRPLAPSDLARSVSLSSWLRPYSPAAPGTRMPLIAAAPANALNSVAPNTSVSSTSSRPKRRSGLSTPKRSIASCHVMRSISGGRSPVDGLGGGEHGVADRGQHVVLGDEAHLGVELHELVLAVGAQVLVAQAAGDLVVAVDAGHHQQLLEQLRRLRQGVERPRLLARRHEELAGPLGRRRHEHRRLDLDEALLLHRPADAELTAAADAQVALHPLAPQVEVAVLQADVLVDVVGAGVDRERRRRGRAQHLDGALADLDLAGRQVGVDRALRPLAHDAGDAHDVLAAHVDRVVDDALHDAEVVADVDEGEVLAVLAAAGDPAAHVHGLADVLGGAARRTGGCASRSRWSTWRHREDCFQVGEEVGTGDDGLRRRRRAAGRTTAVPAARSSSPTITATAAPLRLAAFIWAFMLRPS